MNTGARLAFETGPTRELYDTRLLGAIVKRLALHRTAMRGRVANRLSTNIYCFWTESWPKS